MAANDGPSKDLIAPQPQNDELLEQWKDQKKRIEEMVGGYGSLGHRRMQDLFQIKLDHRFLAFTTSLPNIPNDNPRGVSVDGM
jgi:hypothetical protein